MSLTSESDEAMLPHNGIGSPPADDDNSGGNAGSNSSMKKGPWTSREDEVLIDYVQKHGEGNWNAVQKHTGLSRCGKSCRLRWANHLRPDLKKGPFSSEEERQIIELHAKMGNKWARMAVELPGRTDNEIKNFWNTRIKRRQRAGLPIYPVDICPQLKSENLQRDEIDSYSMGEVRPPDFAPVEDFDIPPIGFKSPSQPLYSPTHDISTVSMPEIPSSLILAQDPQPSYSDRSLCSALHSSKPPCGSEFLFADYNTPIVSSLTGANHLNGDGSLQIARSLGFPSFYEHNSVSDQAVSADLFPGNHTILTSTSELPSLQNQAGGWGVLPPSFPPPVVDDILIQPTEAENTCMFSPRNSGLLDNVLYESEIKKFNANTFLYPETSHGPAMAPYAVNDSTQDPHENMWGYDDQFSPLGHSSSSVFCDGSPFSANSFEELQSANGFPEQVIIPELIIPNAILEEGTRDAGANGNMMMTSSTY